MLAWPMEIRWSTAISLRIICSLPSINFLLITLTAYRFPVSIYRSKSGGLHESLGVQLDALVGLFLGTLFLARAVPERPHE